MGGESIRQSTETAIANQRNASVDSVVKMQIQKNQTKSDINVLNKEPPLRIKTSPKGKTHEINVATMNKTRHNSMPGHSENSINDREDKSVATTEIPVLDEKTGKRNLKFFKPKPNTQSLPRDIDEVLKNNLYSGSFVLQ